MSLSIRIVCFVGLITVLAGCASLRGTESVSLVAVNNDGAFLQTRVYTGGCVFKAGRNESSLGLANAIVPNLISKGVETIGQALRKAGEESIHTIESRSNLDRDDSPECLQLVHGVIAPGIEGARNGSLPVKGWVDVTVDNLLKQQKIYLAAKPDLFVEMRLIVSADKSAIALAATHITYNKRLQSSRLRQSSRSLSAEIVFHGAGVTTDATTVVTTQVVLGEFDPGTVLPLIDPKDSSGNWKPALTSPWFVNFRKSPEMAVGKPVTVTGRIYETRSANKLLLALADVFDDSKDAIQVELEKNLLDSKKQEAEVAELSAKQELLEKHYTALVNAESAILSYCASTPDESTDAARLEASKNARLAQLSTNVTALAAGLPQVYKEAQLVKISSAIVPENCSNSTAQ